MIHRPPINVTQLVAQNLRVTATLITRIRHDQRHAFARYNRTRISQLRIAAQTGLVTITADLRRERNIGGVIVAVTGGWRVVAIGRRWIAA